MMQCPYCSYEYEAHETLEGKTRFKDNDISFCMRCGKVGLYKSNKVMECDEQSLPIDVICEVDRIREAWKNAKKEI